MKIIMTQGEKQSMTVLLSVVVIVASLLFGVLIGYHSCKSQSDRRIRAYQKDMAQLEMRLDDAQEKVDKFSEAYATYPQTYYILRSYSITGHK